MASESKNSSGWFILILIVAVYALRKYPLVATMNIFIFMDGLFYLGQGVSPIAGWIFMGIFIGLIYGSWVACKKYNLNKQLIWLTAGAASLVFVILYLVNQPMESFAY